MFVAILSIALVALTPSGMLPSSQPVLPGSEPSSAPILLGGGGPDAFGYKYLDSDTTAPGAPTYNWVSIKGVGTKVTGLGDDNCVGPFPIGFDFPYYWYKVSTCVVGSNGYITFGDKSANARGFRAVPSTNRPNNQLAPLLSDLDPSVGGSPNGSVWYWSNGTDSFIVEYDSIEFWSTGGNNTFQIILTKADSSITFQYKEQSGVPNLGWTDTCNQTGIENVSGAIGLNYLSGTTPAGNAIHPDLAVRFFPPESTSLQVHDVGVRNAMNDRNGGVFAIKDRPLSFWAVVKNFGNQPEAEYKAHFKVQRTNGAVLFSDSMTATASNPGETESLALASTWRPATNGVYVIKVITKMTGDMLAANDTATLELRVLTLPGALTFDGTPNDGVSWGDRGGLGSRFLPPVYPCSISAVRQYMTATSGTQNVLLAIYDDDGPGEGPGAILFGDTVTATTTAGWDSVNLPTPVVIADGAFFVGGIGDSVSFGVDGTLPVSYQEWENVGGVWSPGRFATLHDASVEATISGPVGIAEWVNPTPAPAPARIDVSPNPFGGMTTIRLLNPTGFEKAIELYDATGSIVRTLELSRARATLDGRNLADGVYFARVAGTNAPVAKVIVTR
jgi:hypothetical protein